ncbi:MAG: cupin domain-containing protein [Reyranella sp.]|uniref:cupin domain-containing protein n=1 Tax=Reyranella sp. TaxID=1929291 RepID=UPI0027305955|nr:cupin domain-containing protein [Reyranella sp.]MDP1963059.1 cupin domain-containing protein [Reyranella sp.]MDP2372525.1 cupin domain-containing protein [Reyranella sp.]
MRFSVVMAIAAALLPPTASIAQNQTLARPNLVHKEVVAGMPKGDKQEVKVLTATIKPGDRTVYHTHRFPVTVYILEGAFTLEMEGRPPVTVKAGESMIEPPHVKMTGYNKNSSEVTKVLIFYVSDPDVPFLDPIH